MSDFAARNARWQAVGGWLGALLVAVLLILVADIASADAGGLDMDKKVAESQESADSEKWAQMSERKRNMEIFSSMVFPALPDVLPSNHPRRLLNKWDGDQTIDILASEQFADGRYRNVVPGGKHYDDWEDVADQFRRAVPGVDFRIVPEGDADIVVLFSDENIYDMMARKPYFPIINVVTRAKNEADARANYSAILGAKSRKRHCVVFTGHGTSSGILKALSFYQNNPEVLHPGLDEEEKRKMRGVNLWKHCAMSTMMYALGVSGPPPHDVVSVLNTTEGHLSDADKFVIRALYSGRVKSGMTKAESLARLFPAQNDKD